MPRMPGTLRRAAFRRAVRCLIVKDLETIIEIVATINEPVTFARLGCVYTVDKSLWRCDVGEWSFGECVTAVPYSQD